jgi:beta-glucuronidase
VWDFAFLGDVDAEAVDPSQIEYHDVMPVPGCFDATPRYAGRRGVAAYRTRVPVLGTGRLRWTVGAAHHRAKLFVQGRVACGHGGGFTRFHADFHWPEPGEIELVALVDNRFDAQRSPLHLEKFDWYQYGGITRGSELHELPGPFIERVEIATVELTPSTIEVAVAYGGAGQGKQRVPFCVTFDGDVVVADEIALDGPSGHLVQRVRLPGPQKLWQPAAPNLHLVGVQLGEDDQFERVGLRQVSAEDGRIWVNGSEVRLKGVNRHEAHPDHGHALPAQVHVQDLQLVEKLGANFVRSGHYPPDPLFLDLCDERGILVGVEAIGWQHGIEDLRHPHFVESQLQHIDEMISERINHPSVILWGVLSDSASSESDARQTYKKLLRYVRDRDPHRLVTFASNRHGSDRCLDLVDVVSINAYPGWSFGSLDELPEDLDRIVQLYRTQAKNKPLLLSEIGAGALYGHHDHAGQRWSEEYQATLLRRVLQHLANAELTGVCLWQLCDTRTTEQRETILGRPRGFDNTGLFDEYRRPKLAAAAVAQAWASSASDET